MRLYLAGRMSGVHDFNRPAFRDAAAQLRAAGYDVVSPAEYGYDPAFTWSQHMRRDIVALCDCDGVAPLSGWHESRGARLEVHVAHALDMPTHSVPVWLEMGT